MRVEQWNMPCEEGTSLFAREWSPETSDIGSAVVIAHGQGEHGERYEHVAETLTGAGIAVLAFDHYGHGRSSGKRGHAISIDALAADTESMLEKARQRHPGRPLFLYGHSMGGNIALNCALRRKLSINGLILTSPWLRLVAKPPAAKEWAGRLLAKFAPSLSQPTGIKEEDLYRPSKLGIPSMKNDPLSHTSITLRAYIELQAAGEWALAHAQELQTPLLLLHGTKDRVTSWDASRELAERLGDRCEFISWKDGMHELHNDLEGKEAVAIISDWILRKSL